MARPRPAGAHRPPTARARFQRCADGSPRAAGAAMSGSTEATVASLIAAAELPADVAEPIDLKEAGLTQRDALLAVCDEAEIWRSPDGESYASVQVDGHVEHHAVASRGFRDWMIAG